MNARAADASAGVGSSAPADAHAASENGASVAPGRSGRLRGIRNFVKRLGPAGPLAVVATVLPPVGAVCLLGLVALHAPSLREHAWAPVACVLGFALLGGICVLPTYAFSVAVGWSFGFAVGFPTAAAGHVAAALVGAEIARHVSGGRLIALIDERPSWRAVHHALLGSSRRRAAWIILLLRLSPVPPFALTNLILGAAHVKRGRFLVGTTIGMIPHALVMVLAAHGLRHLNFKAAEQPWLIGVGIVALLVVVSVFGRVARRALETIAHEQAEEDAVEPA
jgi:uncharacterized membrane protein YdjX (TVP38/TMEM64 family)